MLVIELDAHRNAAAIIGYGNRVIRMDCDDDIITISSQGLIDGVIDNLEHHMMQPSPVGGVANVHSRAFSYSLQSLKLLDTGFVVDGVVCVVSHDGVVYSNAHRHDDVFKCVVPG